MPEATMHCQLCPEVTTIQDIVDHIRVMHPDVAMGQVTIAEMFGDDAEHCRVYFTGDGCDLPRGHQGEERLDSHICFCHPGRSAADFATVFGEDAERLGLKEET